MVEGEKSKVFVPLNPRACWVISVRAACSRCSADSGLSPRLFLPKPHLRTQIPSSLMRCLRQCLLPTYVIATDVGNACQEPNLRNVSAMASHSKPILRMLGDSVCRTDLNIAEDTVGFYNQETKSVLAKSRSATDLRHEHPNFAHN
jgi:hypothetical protein